MKHVLRIGLLIACFVTVSSIQAQNYRDYIDINIEDSYVNQTHSATQMDISADSGLIHEGKINIQYSEHIDGEWLYKCFSKMDEDDFSYFMNDFNGNGWNEIDSLDSAYRYYKEDNKKSVYFSKIYISRYWDFRQVFLETPMAQSVYDVYVNSVKVGANLDTKNIAKFDVTNYVVEGYNSLVIVCNADGNKSGLEDNVVNRTLLNGDVVLYSTPKVRIEDYELTTYFTNNYKKGNLQLNVEILTHLLNLKEVNLLYYLYDKDGNEIMRDNRWTKLELRNKNVVTFHTMINDIKPYSASNPHLYKISLMLAQENRIIQRVSIDVAFMEKKIDGNRILINSVETPLNGVVFGEDDDNEINSDKDYEEDVLQRLRNIKQKGYNSIMLDYPQRPSFYKICDTMGLAVIDVVNVDISNSGNSRIVLGSLANVPEVADIITDRVIRQYIENRNSVSVLAMRGTKSAGNGYALYETYLALKDINKDIFFASNGTDLDWNNDFIIYYPDKNPKDKIDESRISFVVVDRIESYNSWKKIFDKGAITGLFIAEKILM